MIIDWSAEGWRVYKSIDDKTPAKVIPDATITLNGPVILHRTDNRGWIEVPDSEV